MYSLHYPVPKVCAIVVITVFLLCVFLATYVQTVTGFAMGMIILAVIGGLRLMDIPTLTAVASLMSLANVVLALLNGWSHSVESISLAVAWPATRNRTRRMGYYLFGRGSSMVG